MARPPKAERLARRRASVTREALAGFERAIAAHPSEPPAGVNPELHRLVLAGMVSMRDELAEQLGAVPNQGPAGTGE